MDACKTYDNVLGRIADWIDYYNNDRYQWDLALLAPNEYYEYLKTGIYPLDRAVEPDPFSKLSEGGNDTFKLSLTLGTLYTQKGLRRFRRRLMFANFFLNSEKVNCRVKIDFGEFIKPDPSIGAAHAALAVLPDPVSGQAILVDAAPCFHPLARCVVARPTYHSLSAVPKAHSLRCSSFPRAHGQCVYKIMSTSPWRTTPRVFHCGKISCCTAIFGFAGSTPNAAVREALFLQLQGLFPHQFPNHPGEALSEVLPCNTNNFRMSLREWNGPIAEVFLFVALKDLGQQRKPLSQLQVDQQRTDIRTVASPRGGDLSAPLLHTRHQVVLW